MAVYAFEKIENKGRDNPFEVDGEIVETYNESPYNRAFMALVKKPESESDVETVTDFSEGVDETCAGNEGECSREVGDDETYCWQHP